MNDKDTFEISELAEPEELKESEVIVLEYETEPVETWETVEPNIRVKKLNGVAIRYEVKIDLSKIKRHLKRTTNKRLMKS